METEKAHSIKHSHVEVVGYANPLNCSCDGPERGHKTWVKEQGAKTNQGETAALTMMVHSLRKEASEMLCDGVTSRIEDGDRPHEIWKTSKGIPIPPNHIWVPRPSDRAETMQDEKEHDIDDNIFGPCMGIQVLNACFTIISIVSIISIDYIAVMLLETSGKHLGEGKNTMIPSPHFDRRTWRQWRVRWPESYAHSARRRRTLGNISHSVETARQVYKISVRISRFSISKTGPATSA